MYSALVVVAYLPLAEDRFSLAISGLALCLVAKAQNALMLSGHEAVHYLLFRNRKVNDWLVLHLLWTNGVGFNRARQLIWITMRYFFLNVTRNWINSSSGPHKRHISPICSSCSGFYLFRGILRVLGGASKRSAKPQYKLSDSARQSI